MCTVQRLILCFCGCWMPITKLATPQFGKSSERELHIKPHPPGQEGGKYHHSCFTDRQTEEQRDSVICPFHSLYLIGHFPLILKPIHPLENIWANEKTCSASTTDTLGNQCSIVHRACSCSNWIELPNSYLFQLGAGAGPVLVQFLSVNSPKVFKYRMAAWVWTV